MINYAAVGIASFGFVFTRAFQQRNVQGLQYAWVIPTSLVMAAFEVFVIANIVKDASFLTVGSMGVGAGLGCILAMFVHNKYLTRSKA